MTDPDLNEAVAKKLGSTVKCGCDCLAPTDQPDNEWTHTLHYSSDIRAAWEILEALKTPFSMHIYRMTNFEYRCVLQPTDIQARADTAPLAICKAFLKLP